VLVCLCHHGPLVHLLDPWRQRPLLKTTETSMHNCGVWAHHDSGVSGSEKRYDTLRLKLATPLLIVKCYQNSQWRLHVDLYMRAATAAACAMQNSPVGGS